MKLSRNILLKVFFLLFSTLSVDEVVGQDIFLDTFNDNPASYNANNGTQNWAGPWVETNDGNSPNNGRILINKGQFGVNQNELAFFVLINNRTIERPVNLAAYNSAILTLDFQGRFRGNESLRIEFFNNVTGTFELADIIDTSDVGSISYSLTPNQISANSRIRFRSNSDSWPNGRAIFLDNIQIAASDRNFTVSNETVNEAAGTVDFTVEYTGPIPFLGTVTVDFATVDNTAYSASDYTTTSGSLSFNALDRTETITVPIINNDFAEDDETFFIELSNSSEPTALLIRGTGTIIDEVGDLAVPLNEPLSLFDEFSGYFDYAVTGNSLRDDPINTCSIITSSSNTLTTPIPTGAIIDKAYLFWAHSGIAADDVVTFESQPVVADTIFQANLGATFRFYGMTSDVTSIIQATADPSTETYDFTDLSVDNTNNFANYCSGNVTLGGWSLMIFYTEPSLPSVRINIYNGFEPEQNSPTSYTLNNFFAVGSLNAKTTILSWEGDPFNNNDEILSLTTPSSGTNNLVGDGDNAAGNANAFNSTIFDNTVIPNINNTNVLGLDLDTYNISSFINTGETTATVNVNTGNDLIFLNAVVLKVPGNLITGTVFEDINYPGGSGRNLSISAGLPISGATVELYDNTNTLIQTEITDSSGEYVFGGMDNGDYSVRVISETLRSNRGGGASCVQCFPIQTFKRDFSASTLSDITSEVGGANPSGQDTGVGVLSGAQTVSSISIINEGAVDLDFGFNFSTVVNSNQTGQGSLRQFIINSNELDETGLNIEPHPDDASFDPAAGEDTSIFMIPPPNDALGRTPDSNFTSGYFDIIIPNGSDLPTIIDPNTVIDGRSQTVYSASTGDDNTGTFGAGGSPVGVSSNILPNYNLPEIQVHQDSGDVLIIDANNITIRNMSVYSNNNAGIRIDSGSNTIISSNLIGVNANGDFVQDILVGIEMTGGSAIIENNFISRNQTAGIQVNGGTSTIIRNNHITTNGTNQVGVVCNDNILITNGSGIEIRSNLIENAASTGIDGNTAGGNIIISENTISTSGVGAACTDKQGIRLNGSNSSIINNIINNNGGPGIVLNGNSAGNLISRNSIFANGDLPVNPELGIDLGDDGVTINDSGDTDTGPNGFNNFPIIESASIANNNLRVTGWTRPGTTIEFFLSDISIGTASIGDNQVPTVLNQDYGEGQRFLASREEGSTDDLDPLTNSTYNDLDGNTDITNRFDFNITLGSPISAGSIITATATISNTTSEFGPTVIVGSATVITNRKITYRVKRN